MRWARRERGGVVERVCVLVTQRPGGLSYSVSARYLLLMMQPAQAAAVGKSVARTTQNNPPLFATPNHRSPGPYTNITPNPTHHQSKQCRCLPNNATRRTALCAISTTQYVQRRACPLRNCVPAPEAAMCSHMFSYMGAQEHRRIVLESQSAQAIEVSHLQAQLTSWQRLSRHTHTPRTVHNPP